MTVDINQTFQFTVAHASDRQVYTWHPETGMILWKDRHGLPGCRRYSLTDALGFLANGIWVLEEDTGWYERKEFPPIGARVRLNPGFTVTVVGKSTNGDLLVEEVKGRTFSVMRVRDPEHLKPIGPTAHEREVEAVAADLMVTPAVAESIILKGYRKQ